MSGTESIFAVRCKLKPVSSIVEIQPVLEPLFSNLEVEETYIYQRDAYQDILKQTPPLRLRFCSLDSIWVDWLIAYEYDSNGMDCAAGYDNRLGVSLTELHRIDTQLTQLFNDYREPGIYVVAYNWDNVCEEPDPGIPNIVTANQSTVNSDFKTNERWYHVAYACTYKRSNIMSEIICHAPTGNTSIMEIKSAIAARLKSIGIKVSAEHIALLGWHQINAKGEIL